MNLLSACNAVTSQMSTKKTQGVVLSTPWPRGLVSALEQVFDQGFDRVFGLSYQDPVRMLTQHQQAYGQPCRQHLLQALCTTGACMAAHQAMMPPRGCCWSSVLTIALLHSGALVSERPILPACFQSLPVGRADEMTVDFGFLY